MSDAVVNGCRLWYEVRGKVDGEHLVQIGGAGFAHENFSTITDTMARRFRVIEFDLRGYGLSDRPVQKYSMDVWADDLAALLKEAGIARTHVYGTSMGGMVAVRFAAKYPELVDRLIVDCAAVKPDFTMRAQFEVWKRLAQAYGMGSEELALMVATHCVGRTLLDTNGRDVVDNIRSILGRNCSVEVFSEACTAMQEMDLQGDLPKIVAPTLVTDGSDDVLTPLDLGPEGLGGRAIVEGVAGAELHVIEGAGHTSLMEKPQEAAEVATAFLTSRL